MAKNDKTPLATVDSTTSTGNMELTDRQKYLLRACVNAELNDNAQCDTSLSLAETEKADDTDKALAVLRKDLIELRDMLTINEEAKPALDEEEEDEDDTITVVEKNLSPDSIAYDIHPRTVDRPLADEEAWARIIAMLNDESLEDYGNEMVDLADELICALESGAPLPSNCTIKPALTKQGFMHLLYLIRS